MPTLNDLQSVALRGNLVGAYDPKYWVVGLADPVGQTELLTYILDNLGGGTGNGENDITEAAGTPSGAPGAGEPQVYQDTTNGNVYTWDGTQWNIMAVVASNGLTKIGNDIELGGTLEKNTVINTLGFDFIFNAVTGVLESIFRMRPSVGSIDIFTQDTSTNQESSFGILPQSAIIEVNGVSGVPQNQSSQMTMTQTVWQAVVSLGGKIRNRLLLDTDRVEVTAERLEFKMETAQNGAVGHVLTLVDVVTGRAEWLSAPGGIGIDDITEGSGDPSGAPTPVEPAVYQNTDDGSLWVWNGPGGIWLEVCLKTPLPIYDSIADAMAAGLVKGDQFKLSQSNTEGGIAGTVIELLV
jgi:hypothetical protein